MAQEKSTKPSSESCELHDAAAKAVPELNLPEDAEFVSLPPLVSLREMIEKNRRFRLLFPAGLRTPEERWQAKTTEEFRFKE